MAEGRERFRGEKTMKRHKKKSEMKERRSQKRREHQGVISNVLRKKPLEKERAGSGPS